MCAYPVHHASCSGSQIVLALASLWGQHGADSGSAALWPSTACEVYFLRPELEACLLVVLNWIAVES